MPGRNGRFDNTPLQKLDVAGTVRSTGLDLSSDLNDKTNVRPIRHALDSVQRLRGVTYDWADARSPKRSGGILGVIAQEVNEVLPQAVTKYEDGYAVNYMSFIPLLIEAVKELSAEVESLKAEHEGGKRRSGVKKKQTGKRATKKTSSKR